MAESHDQRQNQYQLPPLQQLQQAQRTLMPATISSLADHRPSESTGSLSPVESSQGFGKSRTSPPALHREGTRDRRISAACTACKKRKSKCTGGPPPCKLCRAAGIECVINESLDGRRKLAAKRIQDELQSHKTLLDGILDGLRSPEKTDKIIELIRSHAPLSVLSDYLTASNQSKPEGPRTRVPIELLIEAQEVLSRESTEEQRSDAMMEPSFPSSATHAGTSSSSPPSSAGMKLRPFMSHPRTDTESLKYQAFVQSLHDCPESEAVQLMQDLRRMNDVSSYVQGFQQGSIFRHRSTSPNDFA